MPDKPIFAVAELNGKPLGRTIFSSPIRILEKPTKNLHASVANLLPSVLAAGGEKQIDLTYFDAVLASKGPNRNRDFISQEDLIRSHKSCINKFVDWGHDEKRIIGHMTHAVLIDDDDDILTPTEASKHIGPLHIEVGGVIYKFNFPAEAEITEDAAAGKNKFGISMEALFPDCALLIGDEDGQVIASDDSQFEDVYKMWKAFSNFNGKPIFRKLLGHFFSGSGIVAHPANTPSIIKGTASSELICTPGLGCVSIYDMKANHADCSCGGTCDKCVDKQEEVSAGIHNGGLHSNAGIHLHAINSKEENTAIEDKHWHIVEVNGKLLQSVGVTPHDHTVKDTSRTGDKASIHKHTFLLPNGITVETHEDGIHDHAKIVGGTVDDGWHTHRLTIDDKEFFTLSINEEIEEVEKQMSGKAAFEAELFEVEGKEAQKILVAIQTEADLEGIKEVELTSQEVTKYGDPTNKEFPIHDKSHSISALQRFFQPKSVIGYSDTEKLFILRKIVRASKKFCVQVSEKILRAAKMKVSAIDKTHDGDNVIEEDQNMSSDLTNSPTEVDEVADKKDISIEEFLAKAKEIQETASKALAENPKNAEKEDKATEGLRDVAGKMQSLNSDLTDRLSKSNEDLSAKAKEVEDLTAKGKDLEKKLTEANEKLEEQAKDAKASERMKDLEDSSVALAGDAGKSQAKRVREMDDEAFAAYKEELAAVVKASVKASDDKKETPGDDKKNDEKPANDAKGDDKSSKGEEEVPSPDVSDAQKAKASVQVGADGEVEDLAKQYSQLG